MSETSFLQEVQLLRQLIASWHSNPLYVGETDRAADRPANKKLLAYLRTVFDNSERDTRLSVLGFLINRTITTTLGHGGLTLGETYSLLSWMEGEVFPDIREGARSVLMNMADDTWKWVLLMDKMLTPRTITPPVEASNEAEDTSWQESQDMETQATFVPQELPF